MRKIDGFDTIVKIHEYFSETFKSKRTQNAGVRKQQWMVFGGTANKRKGLSMSVLDKDYWIPSVLHIVTALKELSSTIDQRAHKKIMKSLGPNRDGTNVFKFTSF